MNSSEHDLSLLAPCRQARRRTFSDAVLFFLLGACLTGAGSAAQSTSDDSDTIRGIVVNSVSREPIPRALVFSPDNRFATLTNAEGRFEFTLSKLDPAVEGDSDSSMPRNTPIHPGPHGLPYMLMARKPGFMSGPNNPGQNLQNGALKDLTLALIPESLIVGTVTLPTSEAPDSITLQIYRRVVQDGSTGLRLEALSLPRTANSVSRTCWRALISY